MDSSKHSEVKVIPKLEGYVLVSEAFNQAFDIIKDIMDGKLIPLKTSVNKENEMLRGLLPADQLVIAARSGVGKTSKAIALIDDFFNEELNPHYAKRLVLLYDSWELSGWRSAVKLLSLRSKLTAGEILNWDEKLTMEQFEHLKTLSERYVGKLFYIRDYSDNVDEWMLRKQKAAKQFPFPEYQIVNLIDHARLVTAENNESEERLLSNLMKASVRQRKRGNQINVFLSQMNRNIENTTKDRTDIGNQLPVSSDIFGSDAIFQCSEFVIALHRPGFYNLTEFKLSHSQRYKTGLSQIGENDDTLLVEVVLKNRNGETGIMLLEHDVKYNEFRDINISDYEIVTEQKQKNQDEW
jgi:replicative DNA helicase